MGILFASLLAFLAIEYFLRLPLIVRARTLVEIAKKSISVMSSKRISNHWKEVVALRYARDLATHTLAFALLLSACVPLVVLPALLLDWLFAPDPSTIESFSSLSGLVIVTILSLLYVALRKGLGAF